MLDDFDATALYLGRFVTKEYADIAYKLSPTLPQAQGARFTALVGDRRWDEAKKLLSRMDSGWARDSFEGLVAFHERRPEEAANLFERAIKKNPSSGSARLELGEVYLQMGRLSDARKAFLDCLNYPLQAQTVSLVRQRLVLLDQSK